MNLVSPNGKLLTASTKLKGSLHLIYNYHQHYNAWWQNGNPLYFLHEKSIDAFYARHSKLINGVMDKNKELNQKYFECDDNGPILKDGQPIGKQENAMELFDKELKEYLKTPVNL